jgi:hypothetical protein
MSLEIMPSEDNLSNFVAPLCDLTKFVITPNSYGQDALAILQSQIHHHLVCNSSNNCCKNMAGVTTAISMLHNEIFDGYRDAERHLRNLPYETIELLNVRNRLAGLWCLHAHLFCEFGDNDDDVYNTDTSKLLLWRQLAASILATATSCALVGNHGWIATALLRLLQNTHTSSQPKRFFQDLAYDGLDRAHAKLSVDNISPPPRVPLSGWNADSTDELLGEIVGNNHNHNFAEHQQLQEQSQATNSATQLIKDSFAKLVKSPIQTTIRGLSYLFRDPKAALSLCHELNWIADMNYNMPTTGIDAFPMFRKCTTITHCGIRGELKATTNSLAKDHENRKAYVESLTNYGIESLIPNQCVLCRRIIGPCDAAATIPELYGVCVTCRNEGKTIWRTEWFFPNTAGVDPQREGGSKRRAGRPPKSRSATTASSTIISASSGSSSRANHRTHGRLTRDNRHTDPSRTSSSPEQDSPAVKEPNKKKKKKRKFIPPKDDDTNPFKELNGEFELQQAVVDLIAELFSVSTAQASKMLLNMRKTQNAKNQAILAGYLETVRQRQPPHAPPPEDPLEPTVIDQPLPQSEAVITENMA